MTTLTIAGGLIALALVVALVWQRRRLERATALWVLTRLGPCPTCGGAWGDHVCPSRGLDGTARRCDVCGTGLPIGTRRTHDGRWRCAAHKGAP